MKELASSRGYVARIPHARRDLGAAANAPTRREFAITFDVDGDWQMPASLDYTPAELERVKAVVDSITKTQP